MDIIPILKHFIEEIFAAAGEFQENPSELGSLERRLTVAGERSIRELMGEILTDTDRFLECAAHRREHYTVQRHDKRTLISGVGDIVFSRVFDTSF